MRTKLQIHKDKWKDCDKCPCSQWRNRIVHYRGVIPCDIAVVGEAPGDSENVIGYPFVGPAGDLLDYIIHESIPIDVGIQVGYFNAVGCVPDKSSGDHAPTKESLAACLPKLQDLLRISLRKVHKIVAAGKVAKTQLRKLGVVEDVAIPHPAAILRVDPVQQGQAIRRCVVAIHQLAKEVLDEQKQRRGSN